MRLINRIKRLFHTIGLDVNKYKEPDLKRLLNLYQVDMILDIGAHIGMSGEYFRFIGFNKRIVSFEPVNFIYQKLLLRTKKDGNWEAENIGLGDKNEFLEINVSGSRAVSSSILEMTDTLKISAPDQQFCRIEKIEVRRLDDIIQKYNYRGERLFLKIDVQGYEKKVLLGAEKTLEKVVGIKVEMTLKRQYYGETLFDEMLQYLNEKGFTLLSLKNVWNNPHTGELYQVDGIFFRIDKLKK